MMREVALYSVLLLSFALSACGDDDAGGEGDQQALANGGANGAANGVSPGPNATDGNQTGSAEGSGSEPGGGVGGETTAGAEGQPGGAAGSGEAGAEAGAGAGDAAGDPSAGETTGCDLACAAGQHCVLEEVQCIRAPCPPQPTCAPNPACGGFAGAACPGSGQCVDDPNDDCDPSAGGADCGGLCQCPQTPPTPCQAGMSWDSSPSVCSCLLRVGGGGLTCATVLCAAGTNCVDDGGTPRCVPNADGDRSCGPNTCERGMVCCNASCGTCAPPNVACTQQACL